MRGIWFAFMALMMLIGMTACSEIETEYFKNGVNEVTTDRVTQRYGTPHKIEELDEKQARWTYFRRSSSTVGYTGIGRGESCQAYLLTFDRHNVLRNWEQVTC